jgi:hypothetical protein
MRRKSRWLITLTLCAGLLAASPSASFSSGSVTGAASAKKKCKKVKKGKKKVKKCTPVKKKAAPKVKAPATSPAPSNVPADGTYTGTDGVKITISTIGGNRVVQAVTTIQATTCPLLGRSFPTIVGAAGMPLVGVSFKGGTTSTISGTFVSALRIHLIAQAVDVDAAPGVLCSGTADVTTDLQPGS